MKTSYLALLALVSACALSCSSTSKSAAPALDEQAMMAKWMEFATPGEAHKVLDDRVGYWKLKVRSFNPDGSPAGESDATSDCKWIMDGRFIEDITTGEMWGQTFLGRGLTGFDNIKKKYVGTWVDNMGTGVMTMEGTYDPSTKTMSTRSESPDVANWQYTPSRVTETMLDQDHIVTKFFQKDPEGKEYMFMQIDYARSSR